MERPDVDRLLQAHLPQARFTRKEYRDGWVDQVDLHWLRLQVRVYLPSEAFKVHILGVRTSIDGSSTPLWTLMGEGEEQLEDAIKQLRAEALGAAHAIVHATGRLPKGPSLDDLMA
jgi:hypothetical protein